VANIKRDRNIRVSASKALKWTEISVSVQPTHYEGQKYQCQCSQSTKTDRNVRVSAAKALKWPEISSVSVTKALKLTEIYVSVQPKH